MEDQYVQAASAFVDQFYASFDGNRGALGALYQADSMLTFEGEQVQGAVAITALLANLPLMNHRKDSQYPVVDAQPLPNGGIMVHVLGQFVVAEQDAWHSFSELFTLSPRPNGYYLLNHIFRMAQF